MREFRFIHAADLHLDSPLIGLEQYDEERPVERIRSATREALQNLVDTCIDRDVSFLLIAGDLYNGRWKGVSTGQFFAGQMRRMIQSGRDIPVYLIKGNHDAESVIMRDLSVPNVHLFGHKKAETKLLSDLKVALHGQSFATPKIETNLSRSYPEPVDGYFNIGLLHTSATGRPGHDTYAPCSLTDLISKGYDYWALGHIHKRELLHEYPHILFPGNTQGRHINEESEEGKGCTIVTVRDGRVVELEHLPLDTVRWVRTEVDCTGASNKEEVYSRIEETLTTVASAHAPRLVAIRLTLVGECGAGEALYEDIQASHHDIRYRASYVTTGEVWLEKIQFSFDPPKSSHSDDGYLADLQQYLERIKDNEQLQEFLIAELAELNLKLRDGIPELFQDDPPVTQSKLQEMLPEIEQLLLAQLK